jgi:fatty-acyl-CoA synthase
VKEAAVIGVTHRKWGERPLLLVVPEGEIDKNELITYFEGKVAKFCIPDAVEIVDELPHTATGKLSKKDLRTDFSSYILG